MNVHKHTPPFPLSPMHAQNTQQATPSATPTSTVDLSAAPTVKLTVPPPARHTLDRAYLPVTPTVLFTMSSPTRSTIGPSATPAVMATTSPSMLERWHIILIVVGGIVVVVVILGGTCILCYYWLIKSKRPQLSAEQKELRDRADKLEREAIEMANELPQDPDKRKMKEDLISHKTQEASKLRDQAARLPQERYTDLLEKADQKQREENEMIKNLSSDPQIAKLQKRTIEDTRREKKALRKEAHRCMATDSGEKDENEEKNEDEDGGEQDHIREYAGDGGEPDAKCHSTTNSTRTKRELVLCRVVAKD